MSQIVWASSYSRVGTCYYHCSISELIRAIRGSSDDDALKRYTIRMLKEHGFDAFDPDKLPGSRIIDDEMYLCVTDGHPIKVDGEWYDPEDVLYKCPVSHIRDKLRRGPARIIKQHLTMREMYDDLIVDSLIPE